MAISPELREHIEELYQVFAGYAIPENTGACPCCHTPEDNRKLHSKPLRKLNKEDLQQYAGDAILIWGDENTYRHFLPRIFELLALSIESQEFFQDVSFVLSRLYYGNWREWPNNEQAAVEKYLRSAWKQVISIDPKCLWLDSVEDWLAGISQSAHDIRPFLNIWFEDNSEAAGQNLAKLPLDHNFIQPGADPPDFWADRKHQFGQVRAWLLSKKVKTKLQNAYHRNPTEELEMACTVLPQDSSSNP